MSSQHKVHMIDIRYVEIWLNIAKISSYLFDIFAK